MIFRAYQPQASFLNGEYQLPPLEIADDSLPRLARGAHEPLSVDLLLERARKETGLANYGTRDFIPSLRKLVESVNGDLRQLHEKGRAGIEDRIIRLLGNRLRMQCDVEKHLEILSSNSCRRRSSSACHAPDRRSCSACSPPGTAFMNC